MADIATRIYKLTEADSGCTFDLDSGPVTDGFAVATHPEESKVFTRKICMADIAGFIGDNIAALSETMAAVGTWIDRATGKTWIDVVSILRTKANAIRLGTELNQIAIFDLNNAAEIPTGGNGGI